MSRNEEMRCKVEVIRQRVADVVRDVELRESATASAVVDRYLRTWAIWSRTRWRQRATATTHMSSVLRRCLQRSTLLALLARAASIRTWKNDVYLCVSASVCNNVDERVPPIDVRLTAQQQLHSACGSNTSAPEQSKPCR